MKKISCLLFVVAGLAISSCNKDKVEDQVVDCPNEISYASDIATILSTSCNTAGCHNAASGASGYIFENHSQVSDNAAIILNVIRHEAGFSPMPKNGAKLSDDQINKVACWIQQGKLNN